jgi:hypothetical protein
MAMPGKHGKCGGKILYMGHFHSSVIILLSRLVDPLCGFCTL